MMAGAETPPAGERQTFVLESEPDADGERRPIHGVAQWPAAEQRRVRPTVVVCHGFKGFLEWGFFPPLADLLVDRGFTVVRFNYPGTGMKPGDELVTDLDAFRRNTFSRELADTLRVLGAVGSEIAPGHADPERIGLVGHSRGGGAAVLAAADPAWRDRLRALVTWSAVATFERFGDAEAAWRRDGVLEIQNARTGQALELGIELLEDLKQNAGKLDLEAAAGRRQAPWLIVHGDTDETVTATEAERLAAAAADPKELMIVPGGSHTFGAQHPFVGPTPELVAVFNATQTWLRRHLCGS